MESQLSPIQLKLIESLDRELWTNPVFLALDMCGIRITYGVEEFVGKWPADIMISATQVQPFCNPFRIFHGRIDVETDGKEFHATPRGWERDRARDVFMETNQVAVIRLEGLRINTDPIWCARFVLNAVLQRIVHAQPRNEPAPYENDWEDRLTGILWTHLTRHFIVRNNVGYEYSAKIARDVLNWLQSYKPPDPLLFDIKENEQIQ